MKSLMSFYSALLEESGRRCGTSTALDLKTIKRRFEHEGMSFLTISLARFGKDFTKALDDGVVGPSMFASFGKHLGTPRLFGGFLDLVFERSTGRLLDEPNHNAILAIRQLTLMFAKISLDCTNDRTEAALQKFIQCDLEVGDGDRNRKSSDKLDFGRIHHLLGRDFWSELDRRIWQGEIKPKHGPGSTAQKLIGNSKYYEYEWTTRLEELFPYTETCLPSWKLFDFTKHVTYREPVDELSSQVITVPKTLETPRVIAMEPVHMQYVQQGLLEAAMEIIERDYLLSDFIRFDGEGSQEINQRMAREGSLTGDLATLDLSEASDRVSNQLVQLMTERFPWSDQAIQASRTLTAEISQLDQKIQLNKFASMGSALCFPMEALVFLTVVFVGIERALNRPLTRRDLESLRGRVRVYGDDIIVPTDYVQPVIQALEAFGFVVGKNKSFWTGRFRESCGKDYYAGTDVSIVRMRNEFPASREDATQLVSVVSLRNQLSANGYEQSVEWLDHEIERLIPFPFVEETSPVLGKHHNGHQTSKWDKKLQRPLVRGCVVSSPLPINPIGSYEALLKFLLKRGSQPFEDVEHLERSGRPRRVHINVEWAPSI